MSPTEAAGYLEELYVSASRVIQLTYHTANTPGTIKDEDIHALGTTLGCQKPSSNYASVVPSAMHIII